MNVNQRRSRLKVISQTQSKIIGEAELKRLIGEEGGFLSALILPWEPKTRVRVTVEKLKSDNKKD